jgi:hypothetical protein
MLFLRVPGKAGSVEKREPARQPLPAENARWKKRPRQSNPDVATLELGRQEEKRGEFDE